MGVQVHGQVEPLAQRGHQGARGGCAQQSGHVLDREHVRAGVDDPLGEAEVVVERVELLVRAGQVAGVAERDLRDRRAGLAHGLDRRAHLLDVVERVEDAEDVDAGLGGLGDEGVGDRGGVRRVADRVAAAQQHLQADVRHRLAQPGEPVPRVLGEEAQRHVVRRPAPGLEAEQLRRHPRHVSGHGEQVAGADPGGEQRLVGVAERGVGDADPLAACAGRRRSPPGPSVSSAWREPSGAGTSRSMSGQLADRVDADRRLAVRLVHGDLGQPGEQPGAAVGVGPRLEQVGVLLDEAGRHPARAEVGLVEQRDQERDVGRDATDPELGDRASCLLHGALEGAAAAGELGEHRVEVGGDLGAGVRRTAVEADAAAAGGAVRRDLAGVRPEAVGGVLGGDPALQRRAAQPDGVLAQAEVLEGLAGRDAHLRLHQVDVGDLLGHGVLDLDARVHLDEDVVALGVEQELHRARVAVADLLGEAHRVGAHPLADLRVEVGSRRDLDDLLVATLHRAVALEEVDHVALAVGEDLHLDVARVDHGLLDEHRRVAERALGLAHAGVDGVLEVLLLVDLAHAATATAGDGLHEQRVGQLLGGLHQRVEVVVGLDRLQRGYAGLLGRRDGPGLVAGELEHVGGRADEGDARVGARLGEMGVLGQEAVARVDGVGPCLHRDLDDRVGVEVGPHRVALVADLVGLVGLHPVLGPAVLVGEDRHRARAHLRRGAEGPDRDLATVGHQDLGEHGTRLVRAGHVRVTSYEGWMGLTVLRHIRMFRAIRPLPRSNLGS